MHLRDELTEKVEELDEELTMALTEIKRLKNANKKMVAEVRILYTHVCCPCVYVRVMSDLFPPPPTELPCSKDGPPAGVPPS